MAKSKIVNIKSANKSKRKHEKRKAKKHEIKRSSAREKKPAEPLSPAAKKAKKKRRLIIGIVVVCLLAAAGYSIYKIGVLTVEKYRLEEEHNNLLREERQLKDELKNVQNEEYVEDEAREKLNLILPGEVIYKFSDDKKGK